MYVARHLDFEKIHGTFMQHYSKDPALGEARYAEWVKVSELDDTKGYYAQAAARAKSSESFEWAKFLLQFVKEDKDAKYYKVEALFPVESMNLDSPPFTRDEVLQSARSLTGKPSDLNHDDSQILEGVEIVAAQFEDDCVECLVRVPKTSQLIGLIDRKEIVSVSIKGEWSHGLPGSGLVLTGLAWLTKQSKLPGIPLTRIVPVEQMVESFEVKAQVLEHLKAGHRTVKLDAQQGDGVPACAVCGVPADFIVSICQGCLDKAGAQSQSNENEGETMEEKDMEMLAEKLAAKLKPVKEAVMLKCPKCGMEFDAAQWEGNGWKCPNVECGVEVAPPEPVPLQLRGEQSDAEKLAAAQLELEEKKTALAEAEEKLTVTEGKLTEANSAVEKIKQFVPGVDLLANPPKLMPVSECVERLVRLELPRMQERLSLGNQVQAQKVRREVFEVKQKYGVA